MGRRFSQLLLRLLLVPAFLLAQFACVCSSGAAMPKTTSVTVHACCENDASAATPSHEQHRHDAHCPHCSQGGRVANVGEKAAVAAPVLLSPMLMPLLPALLAVDLDDSSVRYLAFQRWAADPSPPRDLLAREVRPHHLEVGRCAVAAFAMRHLRCAVVTRGARFVPTLTSGDCSCNASVCSRSRRC